MVSDLCWYPSAMSTNNLVCYHKNVNCVTESSSVKRTKSGIMAVWGGPSVNRSWHNEYICCIS